jgi:hypothetical protein
MVDEHDVAPVAWPSLWAIELKCLELIVTLDDDIVRECGGDPVGR